MIAEAVMGLGALKTALDVAKGLKNVDDAVRVNSAVIELQENILAAQQAQMALVNRVDQLEKEVAGFEAWDAQKARYQLQKFEPGTFLYTLKKGMEASEPPHHICPKCYEHRRRSILHGSGDEGGLETFKCHECKADFYVGRLRDFSGPINYDD